MDFFTLILDRAQIHKKFEWLNSAQVRFYSFVADERLSLPELNALVEAASPEEKRATIRGAAKKILDGWESVEVRNVEANHIFRFGDTGRILYRSQAIPQYLDWIMLVIENDDDVRNLGGNIDKVLPDSRADSLAANIMTLAAVAATPQTAAAIAVAKALIRGITFLLKNNENDQLGLVEQSFVRELHYPDGKRTRAAVPDLTGNMWYDYTIFGTGEL
ncbi:hypothetical protein HY478_03095 [Candidatus Uhrbacteria bacterium]|nr:hypothetical protein [Candidatus Uhrbacteria bacterium]